MAKVQASPAPTPAKHAPAAPTASDKPKQSATPKVEKPADPPAIEYVTSKHLADQLNIKSTALRRWLRTLPQFQDGGYTRYKWEPGDPFLASAREHYEKYAASEKEKQEKRLAEAREKTAKKEAKAAEPTDAGKVNPNKKKKAAEPEPPAEETDEEEVFEEDEPGDEGEELD